MLWTAMMLTICLTLVRFQQEALDLFDFDVYRSVSY